MNVSDAIANWLANQDIRHAFGIIGGGNYLLWDAIVRRRFTTIVATHHEQAAAMAATYYYRTCGRMALVLCTTGAGSTNTLTGVMAAWMDSIPLLILAGNEDTKYHGVGGRGWGYQGYDSPKLVKECTKLSSRLTAGTKYEKYLSWHLETALDSRQGPVWIEIPKDVQNETI